MNTFEFKHVVRVCLSLEGYISFEESIDYALASIDTEKRVRRFARTRLAKKYGKNHGFNGVRSDEQEEDARHEITREMQERRKNPSVNCANRGSKASMMHALERNWRNERRAVVHNDCEVMWKHLEKIEKRQDIEIGEIVYAVRVIAKAELNVNRIEHQIWDAEKRRSEIRNANRRNRVSETIAALEEDLVREHHNITVWMRILTEHPDRITLFK
jgi:hypothetical protein